MVAGCHHVQKGCHFLAVQPMQTMKNDKLIKKLLMYIVLIKKLLIFQALSGLGHAYLWFIPGFIYIFGALNEYRQWHYITLLLLTSIPQNICCKLSSLHSCRCSNLLLTAPIYSLDKQTTCYCWTNCCMAKSATSNYKPKIAIQSHTERYAL